MPLFMDFHKIENLTIEAVKAAHIADVAIQDKYGVKYHQFWVNLDAGTVFCLTEGPDKETCELVHKLAHGNIACALTEVETGFYKALMGENHEVDNNGVVKNKNGTIDLGYRTILVTSVRGITLASHSKELQPLQIPHWAKTIVTQTTKNFNGREINWATDDSLIGVFHDTTDAVKCASDIQKKLLAENKGPNVIFKIGISADQPVTKDGEFFIKAIKLAHRLSNTAEDNQILISSLVKKLSKESVPGSPQIKYLNEVEEQFVSKLLDITEENLSNKNFSIESMCKDIGISRTQLYRKITSLTGRAPNDFLRDLRMEKSLVLLKQRDGNVSQVALEVGYNNPSYFSKCFADKFGCTPSKVSTKAYA